MVYQKKTNSPTELIQSFDAAEDIVYFNARKISAKSTHGTSKIDASVNHGSFFLGFFYTFLSSLNFSLLYVVIKRLSYIDVGQLSLMRNAGVFAGCLPILVYTGQEFLGAKEFRILLIARGFIGATDLYLNLTAYRYLPLAEAAIIISFSPVVTTIVARVFLKEPCGLTQIISLVINICGVLTSIRLPKLLGEGSIRNFDYLYIAGIAAGFSCVVTMSFIFVVLRKMKNIHYSLPMMYLGFFSIVENASITVATSSFGSPFCGWDYTMYVLIPPLGFLANLTITLSVQRQAAGIVSVVKSSFDIIMAAVFQMIFFNQFLDVYNISGACLVIISMSILGIRNWVQTLPEASIWRKRLKYFLL